MIMSSTKLSPNEYKMHGYAVFVLQEMQKQPPGLGLMDPLELDWDFLSKYSPETVVPLLKKRKLKETRKQKKNSSMVVSTPKVDIIKNIVDEHYAS